MGVPVVGLEPQHPRAVNTLGSIHDQARSSPGSDETTVGGHRRSSHSEPELRSRVVRPHACWPIAQMSLGLLLDMSNDQSREAFPSVDAHVADV